VDRVNSPRGRSEPPTTTSGHPSGAIIGDYRPPSPPRRRRANPNPNPNPIPNPSPNPNPIGHLFLLVDDAALHPRRGLHLNGQRRRNRRLWRRRARAPEAVEGRPVGRPLPAESAEPARAARYALRRRWSRAEALPRGHSTLTRLPRRRGQHIVERRRSPHVAYDDALELLRHEDGRQDAHLVRDRNSSQG